jgi:glycosyltransferase involved in cell wall biosynthesis
VIIVARDEGETFLKCRDSVARAAAAFEAASGRKAAVTYVDSWSTDGSVAAAEASGFRVVRPPDWYFNCANGRTTGWLLTSAEYVMFLDGDMELAEGWLEAGLAFLASRPEAGGVSGIRDDMRLSGSDYVRIPNYHRVSAPVEGVGTDVGGAVLFRRAALDATGAFEPSVAPEEDFVQYAQMKAKGWELYRIPVPMIVHWDTKIASPAAAVRHLMFSRKALVPGVLLRRALGTDWWPRLLAFKRDLLVHSAWLAALAILPWRHALAATGVYLVAIGMQKGDPLRTAAAPLLRTVYLANFLAGFLLGRPALELGVQHTERYRAKVRELNP